MLRIAGSTRLLDSDPALQLSVDLRNRTIVPLGYLQVALLRRLRDQKRQPPMSEATAAAARRPHLQPQRAAARRPAYDQRHCRRHAQHRLNLWTPC